MRLARIPSLSPCPHPLHRSRVNPRQPPSPPLPPPCPACPYLPASACRCCSTSALPTLLALLNHENSDIAADAVEVLSELTSGDAVEDAVRRLRGMMGEGFGLEGV